MTLFELTVVSLWKWKFMEVEKVHVSIGTVRNIICNKLKYRKTCAKWVPKELTQLHKDTMLKCCTELKECYEREGETSSTNFYLVMKLGFTFTSRNQRQSVEWKHTTSPAGKSTKIKSQLEKSCWLCLGR